MAAGSRDTAGPCGVLCSSDQGVRAGEKRVNFFSETTLCPSEEPSPVECISATILVSAEHPVTYDRVEPTPRGVGFFKENVEPQTL